MTRVLVAEDDAVARDLLCEILRGEGFEVEAVDDGADAIGRAGEGRYDLVVSDVRMDHADGFAVLRAFGERAPSTPVILITAFGDVTGAMAAIQRGARKARDAGVTGYVPSLEAYSFVPTEAEEGQPYLVGRRQVPLGFGWLKPEEQPYGELPMRVNRLAYREFSRQPDLAFDEFKRRLGRELFGDSANAQATDDALLLQFYFAQARSWCQSSPIVSPDRVRAMKERGPLKPAQAADYRDALERISQIAARHRSANNAGEQELYRIARWVLDQWTDQNRKLLAPDSP